MAVAETPLVKKNHQIAQKLIEKVPMTVVAESLTISTELKKHYNLYQLLLFNFQNKEAENFFELIENNLKLVHPLFQTVFKTFLKDKENIGNALQLPPNWKPPIISSNLSSSMPLVFGTLKTSKNGFLSL